MIEDLLLELQEFTEIEAIVLGGSRASNACDPMSDYDIYIYASQPIPEEKRLLALGKYCARAEIGNAFWETEDNVFLKDGTSADLIYRSLSAFSSSLNNTLNYCQPSNGYTTCMWYNLLHSIVLYDPQGQYAALQRKYSMEYPPILRRNILRRSRDLLFGKMPNYTSQIKAMICQAFATGLLHGWSPVSTRCLP